MSIQSIKLARLTRKNRLIAMMQKAKQVKEIQDKFLDVSDNTINKRKQQYKQTLEQKQLAVVLDVVTGCEHPAIKPLISVYCCKSGRFLYNHQLATVDEMLRLYGVEQTKTYLEIHNQNAVCPLMLRTDSEALRQMFFRDPKDYAVYAGIELLHRYDKENKYNLTVSARQNLDNTAKQLNYNENNLIRCNEYLRRLLGLVSAKNFPKLRPVSFLQSLPAYYQNSHGINQFIILLQRALAYIVEEHLNLSRGKIIRKQSILITDIAEISARYNGEKRFRDQKQIKNINDNEALQLDIESIFFDGELDSFNDFQFTNDFADLLKQKQTIKKQQIENLILDQQTKPLTAGECFIKIPKQQNSTANPAANQPAVVNPFLNALLKK